MLRARTTSPVKWTRRSERQDRRVVASSIATVVCCLLAVFGSLDRAEGGTYDVYTCSEAPGGVNNAWLSYNDSPDTLEHDEVCPPAGSYSGLTAKDLVGSVDDTFSPSAAGWYFSAPMDTTISRLRAWRYVGKRDDNDWSVGATLEDGTQIDGCDIAQGQSSCSVGTNGYQQGAYLDKTIGGSHTEIYYGVECYAVTFCANGSSDQNAWSALYGAVVTVKDLVYPELSVPSDSLVKQEKWVSGTQEIEFSASDSTGIKQVGGSLGSGSTATYDLSCDYTHTDPCPGVDQAVLAVDTTTVPDGYQPVKLRVTDAAGNKTEQTVGGINVDNNAPKAPGSIKATRLGADRTYRIEWSLPLESGAPIVKARYRLCPSGSEADCQSPQVAPSTTGIDELKLPATGTFNLSVWLEDSLGHQNAANRITLVSLGWDSSGSGGSIRFVPPGGGSQSKTTLGMAFLRASANGRKVSVKGTCSFAVTKPLTVTVKYSLRRKVGGRKVKKEGVIKKGVSCASRKFVVSLKLPKRAVADKVTATYLGDGRFLRSTVSQKVKRLKVRKRVGVAKADVLQAAGS